MEIIDKIFMKKIIALFLFFFIKTLVAQSECPFCKNRIFRPDLEAKICRTSISVHVCCAEILERYVGSCYAALYSLFPGKEQKESYLEAHKMIFSAVQKEACKHSWSVMDYFRAYGGKRLSALFWERYMWCMREKLSI